MQSGTCELNINNGCLQQRKAELIILPFVFLPFDHSKKSIDISGLVTSKRRLIKIDSHRNSNA